METSQLIRSLVMKKRFNKIRAGFKADMAHPCSQSVIKWREADDHFLIHRGFQIGGYIIR